MKQRSPLSGASRADLQLYRQCATIVAAWEGAARAGNFYALDYWVRIPNFPGGLRPRLLFHDFLSRAWGRVKQLPQADEFYEITRLDRLRRDDPGAYETAMLRKELAEHRKECSLR